GNGGVGIELQNGGSVSNAGSVTGGAGNRGGGSGSLASSHGGDSGTGGTGIDINQQGSVTNESTGKVQGGKGGDDSAGGGGVGGIGGTAVNITGSGSVENKGEFIGGDGGAGANANGTNANGGTGAQGGNGLAINGAGKVTNASGATILGGKGGTGGGGSQGDGGVGGKGGNGVLIGSGGTVVNDGTILGGTGNRGGGGGKSDGGAGGDGVHITTGGGTLSNSGTISGGSGGNAGTATGDAGAGGVGVYGSDMTIINSGTLEGGLNQDGTTRSQAVMFVSGTNSLELQAGYQVLGDVVAGSGDDTLILGGDKNSTFDAANIGDTAQYQGFDHFSKTGNSTWLLQNTTDAVTPWTIYEGILQVAQDGSLGAAGSTLTFDGGTLQMVGGFNFDSARPIVIDTAGGTLDTQGFDTTIAQGITGSGDFTKLGSGALTLTGDSTFSGETTLAEGSIDVTGSLAGAVTAHSGTALSGTGSVGSTTLDEGSTLTVGSKTEDDSALATFTINGALDNSGTVNLSRSQQQAGNQLQVNGDYKGGSNSQMNLSTVLGDDNSQTDHVAIQGSTSGTTWVSFTNVGGLGAQTNRGIEVISVDGSSASDAFKQAGRTVAGAWDYSLVQKGQNWYLTSVNTNPVTPIPQYRPEAGSYLINLAAANTIFNLSLDDREGATEYGTQKAMRSAPASTFWLRQEGGQNRFRAADGQIRTQANRYVAQMGNEFIHGSRHGDDRWGAGLMAGYGNVKGNASSSSTGYHSRSSMDGYSVGAYGTWYQNAQSRQGAYLDSWINYNWFKNQVNGEDLASEHYRSRGFTASLESGYNVLLKETQRQAVYLEPQAQLTWMGVKSPQHTEANGTQIQDNGHGNLQSRLGVRLYLRGHRTEDDGKNREFKPYIEADWLHNTHVAEIRMNDSLISQEGAKNVAQLKLGVQGQISPALNIWGGTGLQVGNDGYSDASAMVGMKYAF
ncbi:autotransporter outer membrane beta-barrel domain-containing protein, partial [Kluyvera cryocrescens]